MAAADALFFGDKFLAMECTLEAETSASNLTQYKLFIGDDKKIRFLEWPSPLSQKLTLTHSQREPDQPRMLKGTDFRLGKNAKFSAVFKLN